MKKITPILLFAFVVVFILAGCKKEKEIEQKKEELVVYHLSDIANAAVKDAKCGIDLANGKLYTVVQGRDHQEDIDIAYGYMSNDGVETRCFLSLSYAGCFCGGSSYFSFGDQPDRQGYSSYSVLNDTKIKPGKPSIDFDGVASAGTKAALDAVFNDNPGNSSTDQVFIADRQDNLETKFTLFTTVTGKRGIIRVKPYTKNTALNYHLQENKISIDILVEK